MSEQTKTFVTQSSIAPLEEVNEFLSVCWENGVLTNNGTLVQRLEKEISACLGVGKTVSVTNGTIALQMALRALDITEGEIITTPFSWIATCSAIRWENCSPVFVDIDPGTFNIDPGKIESAITSKTRAIMAVHVFSNPCDVRAIEEIALRHNLKVIYDGAHAFGVTHLTRSIFDYGDISTCSFHATKLFNSGEGGACFSTNPELERRLRRLRYFGYDEEGQILEDGCNGKLTEIHAALGLANLRHHKEVAAKRREIYECYRSELEKVEELKWQRIECESYNFSYVPVVFESETMLLEVLDSFAKENIFPRRYFYPSLNTLPLLGPGVEMPVSESISKRILCLPSFTNLDSPTILRICEIIREGIKKRP